MPPCEGNEVCLRLADAGQVAPAMSAIVDTLASTLQAAPGNWQCRCALVEALLGEGRGEEARAVLSEVDALPEEPEFQVLAARAYGLLDPVSGLQVIDGILERDPGFAPAREERERLCGILENAEPAPTADEIADDAGKPSGSPEKSAASGSASGDPAATEGQAPESGPGTEESAESFADEVRHLLEDHKKRIATRERRDKIQSLTAGLAATAVLCALMLLVVTATPRNSPPQIVATAPEITEEVVETEILQRPMTTPDRAMPDAGAASVNAVTATAVSDLAMTSFDSVGFGAGNATIGTGFGSSMDFGAGAESATAMFFGSESTGERFLFVLDASASMQKNQVKLRDQELERTLKSIRGVNYQVMLFAGGAYFTEEGWGVHPEDIRTRYGEELFTSPQGDYEFKNQGSYHKFRFLGKPEEFPTPEWRRANTPNIERTVKFVKKSRLFTGTDWDIALELACYMDPPPDVIFFMSDGGDPELSATRIARHAKRHGSPKINTIALQTTDAMQGFADIAEKTGGTYTIVDKKGEPIDGFEYMEDPEKFKGRL